MQYADIDEGIEDKMLLEAQELPTPTIAKN